MKPKTSKTKVTPLGAFLLVRRVDDASDAGDRLIQIPDAAKEKSQFAEVMVLGEKVESTLIQPGVRVMVGRYAGSEIQLDGIEFLLLAESEVIGVVTDA